MPACQRVIYTDTPRRRPPSSGVSYFENDDLFHFCLNDSPAGCRVDPWLLPNGSAWRIGVRLASRAAGTQAGRKHRPFGGPAIVQAAVAVSTLAGLLGEIYGLPDSQSPFCRTDALSHETCRASLLQAEFLICRIGQAQLVYRRVPQRRSRACTKYAKRVRCSSQGTPAAFLWFFFFAPRPAPGTTSDKFATRVLLGTASQFPVQIHDRRGS